MDMSGLKPLNGLGNTLGYYIPFLRDGIHLGRAAFLRRNLPECAPRCSFDPAEFFGGRGGIDYRWSNATACAVARAMSLRGEKEHVFSLVFNESSELREAVGAVDETTGEYLQVRLRRLIMRRQRLCMRQSRCSRIPTADASKFPCLLAAPLLRATSTSTPSSATRQSPRCPGSASCFLRRPGRAGRPRTAGASRAR